MLHAARARRHTAHCVSQQPARCALQEIVKQNGEITVQPAKQYRPGADEDAENTYEEKKITFGQVTVSFPSQAGRDGQIEMVLPAEARLRNLTYACPLKVDVTVEDITRDADTGAPPLLAAADAVPFLSWLAPCTTACVAAVGMWRSGAATCTCSCAVVVGCCAGAGTPGSARSAP